MGVGATYPTVHACVVLVLNSGLICPRDPSFAGQMEKLWPVSDDICGMHYLSLSLTEVHYNSFFGICYYMYMYMYMCIYIYMHYELSLILSRHDLS